MTQFPLLSALTFIPLIGAILLLLPRGTDAVVARFSRWGALIISLVVFLLSIQLWVDFDGNSAGFQFVESYAWLSFLGGQFKLGVDGISIFFVLLSTLLTPICIIASWQSIQNRVREYMIAFLVLETMMIGMFLSLDLILFYIFFEGVLLPMYLIIGVWGGLRRIYAAFKFFLYTLLGSLFMLLAVIAIAIIAGTTDITLLKANMFGADIQLWLWLAFFASFAVKVPMWPVHTWLPDAHVEAPTAGSVILAGVLLKMGGYGLLRLSIPLFPLASEAVAPYVYALSIIAIVYTSLVALAQKDMKKLIAYSSVAHMGFVTIGLFTFNVQGVAGAIFQMLSHGIVSGALFLCVGVLYDRLHTRDIAKYGGVVHIMPRFAAIFLFFTMATIGLPGTSGFVGEFLVLVGTYQVAFGLAAGAALGVILGAVYSLGLYKRVMFGPVTMAKKSVLALKSLSPREVFVFAPLIVVVLWLGIYPKTFLQPIEVSVNHWLNNVKSSLVGVPDAQ